MQLESGEYFLSDKKKQAKKWEDKQEKQAEKTAESKRRREEAFIPPEVRFRNYIKYCCDFIFHVYWKFCLVLQEPTTHDSKANTDDKNDVAALALSLKVKMKPRILESPLDMECERILICRFHMEI